MRPVPPKFYDCQPPSFSSVSLTASGQPSPRRVQHPRVGVHSSAHPGLRPTSNWTLTPHFRRLEPRLSSPESQEEEGANGRAVSASAADHTFVQRLARLLITLLCRIHAHRSPTAQTSRPRRGSIAPTTCHSVCPHISPSFLPKLALRLT